MTTHLAKNYRHEFVILLFIVSYGSISNWSSSAIVSLYCSLTRVFVQFSLNLIIDKFPPIKCKICDCLRTGKSSRYVTTCLGQLSGGK